MYQLSCTSWDNDADNYATHSILLETKADLDFYTDLMVLCSYENSRNSWGNSYLVEIADKVLPKLKKLLAKYSLSSQRQKMWQDAIEEFENNDDVGDLASNFEEILGFSETYDGNFIRVAERWSDAELKVGSLLTLRSPLNRLDRLSVNDLCVFSHVAQGTIHCYKAYYGKREKGHDIFSVEWLPHKVDIAELQEFDEPSVASKLVMAHFSPT